MNDEIDPQAILPGFRRALGYPPKDWRSWSDGKGNKIDAPKWRGRTSYDFSKTVPLPLDKHGNPLRIGDYQVMRSASWHIGYLVADWSKPLGQNCVYTTRDLRRAMIVCTWLHRWRHWQGPLLKGQSRERAVFPKGFPT